jgi:2-iminobutanoate/2-iminopropanoate deaminase
MRLVQTDLAPRPGGHYSQAVIHGDTVYVAGQLPIDASNPNAPPGDAAAQMRQAMGNVQAILAAAGSGLEHVLQMTIYVSDIEHWGTVNSVYTELMGDHRPARAVVPVGELHYGFLVEIQAVAALAGESS